MSDVDSDLEEIPEFSAQRTQNNAQGIGDLGGQDYRQVLTFSLLDDRRAHHNALERKRRDHIKDSFSSLREVVPTLKGEKASRALILKKGAEYIHTMRTRINEHNKDIFELKRQNSLLETQVKMIESRLENAASAGNPANFVQTPEVGKYEDAASTSAVNVGNEEPLAKRVKSDPSERSS